MDSVNAFAEHGGGCLRVTPWALGIMGLILVLDKAFYNSEPDLPPSAPAFVQPHPTEARKEVAWNDCVFGAADRAYLNKGIDIGDAGVGPLQDYKPLRDRVRDLGLDLYEVRGWLTLVYGNFQSRTGGSTSPAGSRFSRIPPMDVRRTCWGLGGGSGGVALRPSGGGGCSRSP